jgi:hypothetical protein
MSLCQQFGKTREAKPPPERGGWEFLHAALEVSARIYACMELSERTRD